MSAPDRRGADRCGPDRYGPDRYGPGRFPGTHVHDAHDGGGATRAGGAAMPGPAGDDADSAVRAGAPLGESVPAGVRAAVAARLAQRQAEDAAIAAAVADVHAAAAADRAAADHAGAHDPADCDPLGRAGRHDGWTGARQRDFLAAIAEGCTVEQACRTVGLSVASAYALRRRAGGAAFALGWQAAGLLAREHVADTLLARALDGQTETVTRPNGDVVERHRYDNRLAMGLLARLDRQAEAPIAHAAAGGAATHHAARMVAGEFDAFLDLVGRDGGPARAALFLGVRDDPAGLGQGAEALEGVRALARADRFVRAGAATAGEVDIADLDPARRGTWTAAQWARAEAAGLLTLAPPAPEPAPEPAAAPAAEPAPEPQLPQLVPLDAAGDDLDPDAVTIGDDAGSAVVWWDEDADEYRTALAPPPGFDGEEEGAPDDPDYSRSLDADEAAVARRLHAAERADRLAVIRVKRDRWFAAADRLAALPVWTPAEEEAERLAA